jgi:multimeric flavodoxin WrbA
MTVLGISGSPHTNGNTEFALRLALKTLSEQGFETELISLADRTIHACDGCFGCQSGACRFDDDMTAVIEALVRCDGLILASPVYMGMVSGQLKTMMDRSVILRVREGFELSGKPAAGIACGGFRNGGQELTLQNMQTYFLQQDMAAIADGPPFSHSGAAICGKSAEDALGLRTVVSLAARMARQLAKLKGEPRSIHGSSP